MRKSVNKLKIFLVALLVLTAIFPLVSAGVGISWDKESVLIPEGDKNCLTYKVYNPWPKESFVQIKVSEELNEVISSGESETKKIPIETSRAEAIPVTFCFKTQKVYEKDCALFGFGLCKQECLEETKLYSGEVEVIELTEQEAISGGTGGSRTTMSVSAPLNVRVQCIEHDRKYGFIYITIALIAGILLAINLLRRRKIKEKKKK